MRKLNQFIQTQLVTGTIQTLTYQYLISFKGRGKHARGNVNLLNYVMQIQRDLQFLQVKFQAGEEGMKPYRVVNKFMEEHQIM